MSLVIWAREFAREVHKTQMRKHATEPYFNHLHRVAMTVKDYGGTDRAIAAAYLHDTIEDQPVTYEDLVGRFGQDVADIVLNLTNTPPAHGINRKARHALDVERLSKADPESQTIKCADLLDNTATIVALDPGFARTYLPEKRDILTVLTRADKALLAAAWDCLIKAEQTLRETPTAA